MYGFVYLWYHAENEEPTWLPDTVPEVESHSWKYRGRSEFRVACHIQVHTKKLLIVQRIQCIIGTFGRVNFH